MKPEPLYQQLKELAEKLGIMVSEANFRNVGIHVRSGFCTVNGEKRFIMDKHAKIHEKIDILAAFLSTLPHEACYVIPAVRELLDRSSGKDRAEGQRSASDNA